VINDSGEQRGVSKGVEEGQRTPALEVATPETAIMPFQGWPPTATGHGKVGHGWP
jgi:hypothetical protein